MEGVEGGGRGSVVGGRYERPGCLSGVVRPVVCARGEHGSQAYCRPIQSLFPPLLTYSLTHPPLYIYEMCPILFISINNHKSFTHCRVP
jgi:hypothetical protein